MSAPRSRRRIVVAGVAALGLAAGYLALAAGGVSVAAPLLVVTYLAIIPAALLA